MSLRDHANESQAHQVLAELELLAHGKTTDFGVRAGASGSRAPTGESHPPHEHWRDRLQNAKPSEYSALIAAAQRELEAWRKRPEVQITEETTEQRELRIIKEGEGWPIEDVARHFKCLPRQVRGIRLRHGVSAATGQRSAVSGSDEAARTKELRENGLSERQIRLILGCGGSKLARLLAR